MNGDFKVSELPKRRDVAFISPSHTHVCWNCKIEFRHSDRHRYMQPPMSKEESDHIHTCSHCGSITKEVYSESDGAIWSYVSADDVIAAMKDRGISGENTSVITLADFIHEFSRRIFYYKVGLRESI